MTLRFTLSKRQIEIIRNSIRNLEHSFTPQVIEHLRGVVSALENALPVGPHIPDEEERHWMECTHEEWMTMRAAVDSDKTCTEVEKRSVAVALGFTVEMNDSHESLRRKFQSEMRGKRA